MTAVADALLLPPGTRLLHIGPHKTGTSSLQSAFHVARPRLAAHDVRYAGRNRQPLHAAQAVASRARGAAPGSRALRPWRDLVREIRAAREQRVVVSSEWFADADAAAIRRIATDLDPARLHVVITVRPLAGILPSQWQQYVQAGMSLAWEPWLRGVLDEDPAVTPGFWHRHRHDRLAARWATEIGAARVTVVVADDRDHGAILRAFERLVGLPAGLFQPEDDRANRSLTLAEIELVRELNRAAAEAGVDPETRQQLVLFGAAANIKRREPGRDEPRISTPAWAREPIDRLAREIAAGLGPLGIRILGDPNALLDGPRSDATSIDADRRWPAVSAAGAMGLLLAAGLGHGARARSGGAWPDPIALAGPPDPVALAALADSIEPIPATRVRRILVARVRRSAVRRLPVRVRRRGRPGLGEAAPIHSMPLEVE